MATTSRAPSSEAREGPRMNMLLPILLIVAVGTVALLMRGFGPRQNEAIQPSPGGDAAGDRTFDSDDSEEDDADLDGDDHEGETVPITSEGVAFIRDWHEVRLL